MICASCGTHLRDGLRFCTTCGSRLPDPEPAEAPTQVLPAAPPVAPPAAPPTLGPPPTSPPPPGPPAPPAPPAWEQPTSARPRRTGRVLLVALAVVALLGVGAGGAALLLGGDEDDTTASDTGTQEADPTVAESPDDAAPTAEPPASETAAPVPSASAPTASVEPPAVCWDGPAPSLEDCTTPVGEDGLRWVFPSMDRMDCRQEDSDRRLIYQCDVSLPDGSPVRFNYSEWEAFPVLAGYYRNPPSGSVEEYDLGDGRIRWDSTVDSDERPYKAALAYRGRTWSVTVYSSSEAARDQAVEDLLEMRPREEIEGVTSE